MSTGPGRLIVAKIGTSSLTDPDGAIVPASIEKLCAEVAALRARGERVVVVSSGAIAAGLPILGLHEPRPTDMAVLQAVSAVGQAHLVDHYNRALSAHGLIAGQVLLAPLDFVNRQQYLHARQTLSVLLGLGVVPVINENDAIADDEIRFGDNDRLAALVSHLLGADLLVLLTDTPGLLTANPRIDRNASLIEEVVAVDHEMEALAGGRGTARGSGGMASKLAAAKMAAWSGVRVVIAAATRPDVLATPPPVCPEWARSWFPGRPACPPASSGSPSPSGSSGTVVVDEGARSGPGRTGCVPPAGRRGRRTGRVRRRRRRRDRRPGRTGLRQGAHPPSRSPGQGAGGPPHVGAPR